MFDSNNFQFQIDKEKFYVMDHLSLDYADKCMLLFYIFHASRLNELSTELLIAVFGQLS